MNEEHKTDNFAVLASRQASATQPYRAEAGPMRKRFTKTVELAEHVKSLAVDLCEALAGGPPPTKGITMKRGPSEKGFFAELDAQAAEIENHLENLKAVIEHMRRMV